MDVNSILARSQQRVVQFACTMLSKPEMSKRERDTLKKFLTDADSDLFQLTEEPVAMPGMPKPHYVSARQYSVGPLSAKAPSLIFAPDGINIIQVISIGSVKTGGDDTLQNAILNKKMRELFMNIQGLFKSLKYTRAGKIFEFNLGPFNPQEKKELLGTLLPNPDEIVQAQSRITRLVKVTEELNATTDFSFGQADVSHPFMLQVKVDINSRHLQKNLEARNIDQVFTDADSIIQSHLEWLFGAAI
jgi:hypothetical protein